MEISSRVEAFIEGNFSPDEAGILRDELASLEGSVSGKSGEFSERIASAIIILAKRDFGDLGEVVDTTKMDWRDILVAAGLQNDDWRVKVDALLGS